MLNPGEIELVSKTPTSITIDWAVEPSGGKPPYVLDAQLGGVTVGWNITLPYTFSGLTPNSTYGPRVIVTDSSRTTNVVTATTDFDPAGLGTLLAKYDFLQGADAGILYDRKAGGGSNGTVGAGGSWSARGYTPGGASGWALTPIEAADVGTILVYMTPVTGTGAGVIASFDGDGVLTPLYVDLIGKVTDGHLFPRIRDLNASTGASADTSSHTWPFTLGATIGSPVKLSINGVQATVYDGTCNAADFNFGASLVSFGDNFVSGAGAFTHVYHYALIFSDVLSEEDQQRCHEYMANQCAARSIPVGGPETLVGDLLCLVGNSLTQSLDSSLIVTERPYDRISSSIVGGTPELVVARAIQAFFPLVRPLAERNVIQAWLSPNGTAAESISAVEAFCAEVRSEDWKVSLVTAISAHNSYDVEKNALNAMYDAASFGSGGSTLADVLCDLRSVPQLSADGAYANTDYFVDGLHPTALGRSLEYPVMAAAIDELG